MDSNIEYCYKDFTLVTDGGRGPTLKVTRDSLARCSRVFSTYGLAMGGSLAVEGGSREWSVVLDVAAGDKSATVFFGDPASFAVAHRYDFAGVMEKFMMESSCYGNASAFKDWIQLASGPLRYDDRVRELCVTGWVQNTCSETELLEAVSYLLESSVVDDLDLDLVGACVDIVVNRLCRCTTAFNYAVLSKVLRSPSFIRRLPERVVQAIVVIIQTRDIHVRSLVAGEPGIESVLQSLAAGCEELLKALLDRNLISQLVDEEVLDIMTNLSILNVFDDADLHELVERLDRFSSDAIFRLMSRRDEWLGYPVIVDAVHKVLLGKVNRCSFVRDILIDDEMLVYCLANKKLVEGIYSGILNFSHEDLLIVLTSNARKWMRERNELIKKLVQARVEVVLQQMCLSQREDIVNLAKLAAWKCGGCETASEFNLFRTKDRRRGARLAKTMKRCGSRARGRGGGLVGRTDLNLDFIN